MRVVIVMLVTAWLGGLLLPFGWDYVSAAGNETVTRALQPSSADTYLSEQNPDTNYGSDTTMNVKTKSGQNSRSLVQFDFSSIPAGSTVNSANLSLYLSTAPSGSRTHDVHRVTSSWAESTVTWNTALTFAGTATASISTGTADGVWLIWDVTTDVSAYLGGTTNFGWIVKDSVEGNNKPIEGSYATKEEVTTSLHPTLSITFTAPWESYENLTPPTMCDNFAESNNHVYMQGTGFPTGSYTVGYYDGDGILVVADDKSANGILNSEYQLDSQDAAFGTWHALVQPFGATSFPATYAAAIADPDGYELLADDSFNVEASAIPEFPTVMAGIMVAGLCFGIYYWMRKRRLAYVKA